MDLLYQKKKEKKKKKNVYVSWGNVTDHKKWGCELWVTRMSYDSTIEPTHWQTPENVFADVLSRSESMQMRVVDKYVLI